MDEGDVETLSKRGQWVNRVIGDRERSASFRTREEAVDAGRILARHLGTSHIVHESEETGVITDERRDGRPERDDRTRPGAYASFVFQGEQIEVAEDEEVGGDGGE